LLFRIALAALNALEALKAVTVLTTKLAGNATRLADHFEFGCSGRFHTFIILQGLAVCLCKSIAGRQLGCPPHLACWWPSDFQHITPSFALPFSILSVE
jgi:hypothetical protein